MNQYAPLFWLSLLTLVLVLSAGSHGLAVERLSDAERRHVIEKMYLDYRAKFPEVADIDPGRAALLAREKNVLFIDTRKQEEQRVSMLPGAISARVFLENPEKYEAYTLIAYCTIAYRSGKFAQRFSNKGIPVLNLRGGILAWTHAGGKVYDQNGLTDRIHVYGHRWDLAPESYTTMW